MLLISENTKCYIPFSSTLTRGIGPIVTRLTRKFDNFFRHSALKQPQCYSVTSSPHCRYYAIVKSGCNSLQDIFAIIPLVAFDNQCLTMPCVWHANIAFLWRFWNCKWFASLICPCWRDNAYSIDEKRKKHICTIRWRNNILYGIFWCTHSQAAVYIISIW